MENSQISQAVTAARRSLAGIFAGKRFPDRAAWKLADVAREVADMADPITAGSITCASERARHRWPSLSPFPPSAKIYLAIPPE